MKLFYYKYSCCCPVHPFTTFYSWTSSHKLDTTEVLLVPGACNVFISLVQSAPLSHTCYLLISDCKASAWRSYRQYGWKLCSYQRNEAYYLAHEIPVSWLQQHLLLLFCILFGNAQWSVCILNLSLWWLVFILCSRFIFEYVWSYHKRGMR